MGKSTPQEHDTTFVACKQICQDKMKMIINILISSIQNRESLGILVYLERNKTMQTKAKQNTFCRSLHEAEGPKKSKNNFYIPRVMILKNSYENMP